MSAQAQLVIPQTDVAATGTWTEEDFWGPDGEEDRIRAIFGLSAGVPLPRVTSHTLGKYHAHLSTRLSFPFRALYAETRAPIVHLVRYIFVVRLLNPAGPVSRGILCRVEALSETTELPLVEIGVPEDDPNSQLLDDFAYWFLNCL